MGESPDSQDRPISAGPYYESPHNLADPKNGNIWPATLVPHDQVRAMAHAYLPIAAMPRDPYGPLVDYYQPALDRLDALVRAIDADLTTRPDAPLSAEQQQALADIVRLLPPPDHPLCQVAANASYRPGRAVLDQGNRLPLALLWLYGGPDAEPIGGPADYLAYCARLEADFGDDYPGEGNSYSPEDFAHAAVIDLADDLLYATKPADERETNQREAILRLRDQQLPHIKQTLIAQNAPQEAFDEFAEISDIVHAQAREGRCDPSAFSFYFAENRHLRDAHLLALQAFPGTDSPHRLQQPAQPRLPDLLQQSTFIQAQERWGQPAPPHYQPYGFPRYLIVEGIGIFTTIGLLVIAGPLFRVKKELSIAIACFALLTILVVTPISIRGRLAEQRKAASRPAFARLAAIALWRRLHRHGAPAPTDSRGTIIAALLSRATD